MPREVDNTPSGILKDIEDFTLLLQSQASEEVLTKALEGFSPDDIQLRYLFVCQMLATTVPEAQRGQMHMQFIMSLARQAIGDDFDDIAGDTHG